MENLTIQYLTQQFEDSDDHRILIGDLAIQTFTPYTNITVLTQHDDYCYILKDNESIQVCGYEPSCGIHTWYYCRNNIYRHLGLLSIISEGTETTNPSFTFKGYTHTFKDGEFNVSVMNEIITKIDSGELVLCRRLCGTLDASLRTTVAIKSLDELRHYIGSTMVMCDLSRPLRIEKYGRFDTRCGWDTHIVYLTDSPLLYISGSLSE